MMKLLAMMLPVMSPLMMKLMVRLLMRMKQRVVEKEVAGAAEKLLLPVRRELNNTQRKPQCRIGIKTGCSSISGCSLLLY